LSWWEDLKTEAYWAVTGKERFTHEYRGVRRDNPIRTIDALDKKNKKKK
jgi:hypothetical protein